MSETLGRAREIITTRIAEIDAEADGLRRALGELGGGRAATRTSPAEAKPRRRKVGAKRAPRGQRRKQVLAAVEKSPGVTAAEIGREVGFSTNQAYGVIRRLLDDKQVKKQGKGYRVS